MLWYSKSLTGRFTTLLRGYGSAFPRSIPPSLASAALTWLLHTYAADWIRGQWDSQVSYQAFAYILGVVIVFRTNCAYQRYNAARSQAQQMTASLTDACAQVMQIYAHAHHAMYSTAACV